MTTLLVIHLIVVLKGTVFCLMSGYFVICADTCMGCENEKVPIFLNYCMLLLG